MSVIDDYLANASPEYRRTLEHIRSVIQEVVPGTKEVMSYGIPTLDYKDKHLMHFAAFKDHMSIFPGALTSDIQAKVQDFKIAKGTIQFTTDHLIPDDILREITLMRKTAIDEGNH